MKKNRFTTLSGLTAGKASRPGIKKSWRDGLFALKHNCMEFLKAMMVPVAVSFVVMALVF